MIKFCNKCKKYTLKEICSVCKSKTSEKAYKFKAKWASASEGNYRTR